MEYNNLTYIIVTAEKARSLDYSEFLNRDSNYLRYNTDKNKAIIKYKEEKPSSVEGETTYTHQEILTELEKEEWNDPISDEIKEALGL